MFVSPSVDAETERLRGLNLGHERVRLKVGTIDGVMVPGIIRPTTLLSASCGVCHCPILLFAAADGSINAIAGQCGIRKDSLHPK